MYPQGFHPVRLNNNTDGMGRAPCIPRSSASVRYYYIDYGMSVHHPLGPGSELVVGSQGRDREVPELSKTIPYDPFKADIFIIGNLFRRHLYDKYSNVGFFIPLVKSMTRKDPNSRPTAAEALSQWKTIREGIPIYQRKWAARQRDGLLIVTAFYDVLSVGRSGMSVAKWALGWQ